MTSNRALARERQRKQLLFDFEKLVSRQHEGMLGRTMRWASTFLFPTTATDKRVR